MQSADRLIGSIRSHRKSIALMSSALVLASAGTASAAAIGPAAHARLATAPVAAAHQLPAQPAAVHAGAIAVVQQSAGLLAHPAAPPAQKSAGRHYQSGPGRHHRARSALAAARIAPAADRLLPVATAGPQNAIPITAAQYANAAAIVHQAMARRMGVRSAVIAVATAMQESKLLNLSYGTGDSLGLFQQQWDMGWGTPRQLMNPAYAAGKFLAALRGYQATDPAWASQPLYQAAQGVQRSAFPLAYAQWERQAAHLTGSILRIR